MRLPDAKELAAFVAPAAASYIASRACPVGRDYARSPVFLQPPPWVFGVVWPALYALLGYSWASSVGNRSLSGLHAVLTACLVAYIPTIGCLGCDVGGLVLIGASLYVASRICSRSGKWCLLLPLCIWLGFAGFLSFQVVFRNFASK